MARYRLRFLLQEFDLPQGSTLIGRSSDCQVTIEDPLVSRQHARIDITGDTVMLHDLGSRNGVKVNGKGSKTPVALKDGDRLRVGTQELVFCEVAAAPALTKMSNKTTGFLRYCARCQMPYPQEIGTCPNCGSDEQLEEETLSGHLEAHNQDGWNVQLLVEVFDHAMKLERFADGERILRRATTEVEERFLNGQPVDPKRLELVAQAAARLALSAQEPEWGRWVAEVYRRTTALPPVAVIDKLMDIGRLERADLTDAVEQLLVHARSLGPPRSDDDRRSLAQLETLRASLIDAQSGVHTRPLEKLPNVP